MSKKCEHNRSSQYCKECKALGIGGASICEHNRHRYACKECGGGSICEHDRRRSTCKECTGGSFCEHRCHRYRCSICTPSGAFKICENSAKERKLSFSITLAQFISVSSLPCVYCFEKVELRGIDRWNNNIGYEFENCRPCCKTCNFFKRDMDGLGFVEHCRQIADHTRSVESIDDFEDVQQLVVG